MVLRMRMVVPPILAAKTNNGMIVQHRLHYVAQTSVCEPCAQESQPKVCATTMKPTIHLALTHDWELRGDGSGDIEQIQFAPLRRLLEIYAQAGARTTILPDVMQQ